MPLLKFWDGIRWGRVGGASATAGYVPVTGGTITGDLTVDAADPWDAQVITPDTLAAGIYRTSGADAFDGNIRFTSTHPVDFGGVRATNAGRPTVASDAATKDYIDTTLLRRPQVTAPELGAGWEAHGEPYGEPGYRVSGVGAVVLEGVLRATTTLTPGATSPPLFTLPDECRPDNLMMRLVMGGRDTIYALTITTDGVLQLSGGPQLAKGGYLSIDGVRFNVS